MDIFKAGWCRFHPITGLYCGGFVLWGFIPGRFVIFTSFCLFLAGEEIEEVFAEDYDEPAKDAEPEPETAALAVNGDKEDEEEEQDEEEDNNMREVSSSISWRKTDLVDTWPSSWENLSLGFATRKDSNRPVQPQRLTRVLKFWI